MAYLDFVIEHLDDIRNYVQPAIRWREGRFAASVARAEAAGGDFAEVLCTLPGELRRDDVAARFREDLYGGFVAAIVWGGLNRYRAGEIARRNDRPATVPKLERLRGMLSEMNDAPERMRDILASMRRGRENYFFGIGPSYFTKLLYFLSAGMELGVRPLIYDENMKPAHFALMPDFDENPFDFYAPAGDGKVAFAEETGVEEVYLPYCRLLGRAAAEFGVDVANLESWLFGWPAHIRTAQQNPRAVARREAARMALADRIYQLGASEDVFDAIAVARIFHDNALSIEEVRAGLGHPIIINETDNYVHLEYAAAAAIFKIRGLSSELIEQRLDEKDGRYIDVLNFQVEPEDFPDLGEVFPDEMTSSDETAPEDAAAAPADLPGDSGLMDEILKQFEKEWDELLSEDMPDEFEPRELALYFDITAGYEMRRKGLSF